MCSTEQATPLEDLEREICELSAHIAAAMCRFLILLAEWDERGGWCEWGCRSCAQKLVRTYRGVLSATLDAARDAFDARRLSWHWEDDGSFTFRGRLTADEGALLVQAIDAARNQAPAYVDEQPPPELAATVDEASDEVLPAFMAPGPTAAERDADALVAVARASLERSEGARPGGDPCQLVVHVDADTLASDEVRVRSDLDDGPSLAPETVRRLGCDAALVRIVERDGQPLSVGRRTRTVPPALRRALRSRDRGCRFPGCTHERFLHAHHIKHWARGGETSIDNLVTLCSYHHRLVHESGFGVERVGPHGVRFRRPDGRIVPSVGAFGRAHGPGLVARQRAAGLRVDDRTCRAVSAGAPLDYSIAVEGLIMRDLPDP